MPNSAGERCRILTTLPQGSCALQVRVTNEKASLFSITKKLAAPYLSLEPWKSQAEFLYLFYLLLVLQMAESAGAILICNSTVLHQAIKGRNEYCESEDRESLGKDFQRKRDHRRMGGGRKGGRNKARERKSRETAIWRHKLGLIRPQRQHLEKEDHKIFKKIGMQKTCQSERRNIYLQIWNTREVHAFRIRMQILLFFFSQGICVITVLNS